MIDKREGDVEAEHTRESVILYVCVWGKIILKRTYCLKALELP